MANETQTQTGATADDFATDLITVCAARVAAGKTDPEMLTETVRWAHTTGRLSQADAKAIAFDALYGEED